MLDDIIGWFGALGVGINVFVQGTYPSVAIQVVWASIAIYGLYKAFNSRINRNDHNNF